jgi:hypothetical protein
MREWNPERTGADSPQPGLQRSLLRAQARPRAEPTLSLLKTLRSACLDGLSEHRCSPKERRPTPTDAARTRRGRDHGTLASLPYHRPNIIVAAEISNLVVSCRCCSAAAAGSVRARNTCIPAAGWLLLAVRAPPVLVPSMQADRFPVGRPVRTIFPIIPILVIEPPSLLEPSAWHPRPPKSTLFRAAAWSNRRSRARRTSPSIRRRASRSSPATTAARSRPGVGRSMPTTSRPKLRGYGTSPRMWRRPSSTRTGSGYGRGATASAGSSSSITAPRTSTPSRSSATKRSGSRISRRYQGIPSCPVPTTSFR